MSMFTGKVCPFCKTAIGAYEEAVACPACGMPHHRSCWEENKGCTTFGCSEARHEPQGANFTDVCGKCGTPLSDGQDFCPKCGTRKCADTCKRCGAKLQEWDDFCPACGLCVYSSVQVGKKPNGWSVKRSKKSIVPIVVACAVIVAVLIGAFVNNAKQAKRVEEKRRYAYAVKDSGSSLR
ncbi:MAG: zinc ribbon domain-containing protein [Clostridiales bacterium]|jgi:RNA polymerase subunit RPABC4/transcription elongation factor Spt4|nr:zinc ribbon domain-containing protein [Clostridiales bacterium]